MTQNNGFLGTIGWIKSNLMVSSQASEKGYSNENFYPGAESIPESEPKATYLPISFKTNNNVTIDDHGVANFVQTTGYGGTSYGVLELLNTPDLSTLENWEFGFKAKVNTTTSNTNNLAFCYTKYSVNWLGVSAFDIRTASTTASKRHKPQLYSSSDSEYQLTMNYTLKDSVWHKFTLKWEKGKGYTLTVDDHSIGKYRASISSNAGENIKWGHTANTIISNTGSTVRAVDTKSVYLKWWNS